MKLSEVSEWEQKDAITDQDSNVLCPHCKKNLAIVTKYGMIRNCSECGDRNKETFHYSFVDANGFKSR